MTVYFLGAGPGDPDLLTVRGASVLGRAEVVVHGAGVDEVVLAVAPDHAELVDVGPGALGGARSAAEIIALLVDHGRSGRHTVRVERGDPFAFSPIVEEAKALLAAGIDFEVVPGVSEALALPASAGIPVTPPHPSTSFTVVTWRDEEDQPDSSVDWEAVARTGGTIVLLDSAESLRDIAERLIVAGLSPDTPAAAIQHGASPRQATTRATLTTLAGHELDAASTIVVGAAVATELTWFERRPLFGQRVVVTRPEGQAAPLVERLRELGAIPIGVPTIEITGPDDGGAALTEAIERLDVYDWVVLTSPNGAERLLAEIYDGRDLGGIGIAVIGPGTAAVMAEANLIADLVPERYVAEGLLEVFPEPPEGGGRVLLARAAEAREVLPEGLRRAGWKVDVVDAYRTVAADVTDDQRQRVQDADIATFTSSSTVARFVETFGLEAVPPRVACLGPITARTARELGIDVTAEAEVHTIDGLIEAVIAVVAE